MISNPDSVFNSAFKFQVLAALCVNTISFSHGIGLGWVSPMLNVLQSDESPFGAKISVAEASWVGACLSIGGLVGILLYGSLMNKIGRKRSLLLLIFPQTFFWITVFFATEVYHLYIGRCLAGTTGGGIFVIVPIFVAEISDNQIRGRLASLMILFLNIGIVVGYIFSTYLSYKLIPCICIVLPIIYFCSILNFPDTPHYLLKNGNENDAETAMKFYRNYTGNTKEEYKKFKEDFNDVKNAIQSSKADSKVTYRDFITPKALKAIGIGLGLMILNQFSGSFAIINYSSNVFASSGSEMDPNTNTIIVGVVQVFGAYVATLFVDKFGRKILLIVSSFGMFLGLSAAGVYSYFAQNYPECTKQLSWVPLVTVSFVIFIATIGIISVGFVVLVEVLPSKIRSSATMICMIALCVMAFVVLKMFPILMHEIGLSGVMAVCALFAAAGLIFVIICVPETKGKSLESD